MADPSAAVSRSTAGARAARALALALAGQLLGAAPVFAQSAPSEETAKAAARISDFFGSVGDRMFKDCIYELSEEQLEVQRELVKAYIAAGATDHKARQLAASQIEPPKPSAECERLRDMPTAARAPDAVGPAAPWASKTIVEPRSRPRGELKTTTATPPAPAVPISLAGKTQLPMWDCAPGVDYVTIRHNGYERKLTAGEICNPFEDVVHQVPSDLASFRLGYTIRTGRLFVVAEGHAANGKTIAWGLSGRDLCRNNPDPDCLATRAVGPLPPGEYSFARDKAHRVTWGPKTKRHVAAVYLSKLWHRERYGPQHAKAILARGNIAIHVRLKGEMSEACIGLEPKGWEYVAGLIRDGRATSLLVYIDEPFTQLAEKPPIITSSGFSLSSLFK